jgi:integrase
MPRSRVIREDDEQSRRRPWRSYGLRRVKRVIGGREVVVYVDDHVDGTGTRRRVKLGDSRSISLEEARRRQRHAQHARDLEAAGDHRRRGQDRAIGDVVDAYLADLRGEVGASHHKTTSRNLRAMVAHLGAGLRIRDLTPARILAWRKWRREQTTKKTPAGPSVKTMNMDLDSLKACLSWAVRSGLIGASPAATVRPLRTSPATARKVRRALDPDEIARLLEAAEEEDRELSAYAAAEKTITAGTKGKTWGDRVRRPRVPQAPLWRFLVERAPRWGEAVAVEWRDVVGDAIRIRPLTVKSGHGRELPLSPTHVADLARLREIHAVIHGRPVEPEDRVYLAPKGVPWVSSANGLWRLRKLLTRAEIPRVDAVGESIDIHALRTTAITMWARQGVPIQLAARLAGHASISMTARYYTKLHLADTRAALDAAEGRSAGKSGHPVGTRPGHGSDETRSRGA